MTEILAEFPDALPPDWRFERVDRLCSICRSGGTPSRTEKSYWEDGTIPFAMIEDLTGCGLYLSGTREKVTAAGISASSAWIVPAGAVLVSMYATVGETAINTSPMATNQAILALRVLPEHSAEYVAYCISYFRGWLLRQRVESTQKNVNKGIVTGFEIPVPPLDEQRQIAAVLSSVQRATEGQKRMLGLTEELKRAIRAQLFTQGTRGERLKQTQIGAIPESWTVSPLKDLAESFQYGTSVKCDYNAKGMPVLRIPNVVGGHLNVNDLKFGTPKKNELETVRLRHGDLLFVRTNGVLENAGRCSMYRGELGECCYFASYLIRVRLLEGLAPTFLEEYARTDNGMRMLSGRAARTADGKFNINTGTLETLLVPKPEIHEQKVITDTLACIDKKARNHAASIGTLEALFGTLLHQLMTAKLRVRNLDLAAIDATVHELVGAA